MNSGTLKERKKREQEDEAKILRALTCRKKILAEAKRENRRKKKSVSELLARLTLKGVHAYTLRPAENYVPRSHNLDRQLTGLLDHLFVRYPVPPFLYQAFQGSGTDDFAGAQEVYRTWFVTLAQGGSFPKAVKGVMTSREACVFLRAPWGRKIHENVWWAKLTVAGVPDALRGGLIDRVFTNHSPDDSDGRLAETILFYARHHQGLSRNSFDEVTDFLAHKLRHDREFRMQGRTAASVVKLSNEWHLQMQRAKLGKHIQWHGLGIADWAYEDKNEVWFVTELRDNKELVNEGRKQKHCVYSYVQRCIEGRSCIFSMRACRKIAADYDAAGKPIWDKEFETRRVTVEVGASRSVVQIRGPLNRAPIPEEKEVLRRWAGEKGITL
jgi:hypothetical protein